MIEKLIIRNFQAHERLVLHLDPHVTTIVGPSDVGKSAVLRALRWVALNKPQGTSFLRDGEEKVSVTVKVDGHKVTRSKGKRNTYHLDGKTYEAFHNDVPKEIANLLKVSDLNFQSQHDSPFWLSESPAEVSRRLNEVVDLSLVDTTLANLANMLRRVKIEQEIVDKELQEAAKQKEELHFAEELHQELTRLEQIAEKRAVEAQKLPRLASIASEVTTHKEAIERLKRAVLACQQVVDLGLRWENGCGRVNRLALVVNQGLHSQYLASSPRPDLSQMETKASELKKIRIKSAHLNDLISEAHNSKAKNRNLRSCLKETENEFTQAMGKICAFCGQQIPQS